MSLIFGIVMGVILLPTVLIMFFILYPKNWKNSKLILGLSMKKEYREGETADRVNTIYTKRRSQAIKVLLFSILASIVLIVLPKFILQTTVWMMLLFISIIGLFIPFFIGNKEMKSLKRSLGLGNSGKISYTDTVTAGNVHTVTLSRTLIPNIIGLLVVIAALLVDLKVIKLTSDIAGNFLGTGITAIFWLVGLLLTGAAYMMDGIKNEVISSDSVINSNYNRAKKKNLSDFSISFLWINVFLLAGIFIFTVFKYSEWGFIACTIIYLLIVMAGIVLYVGRDKKIERLYEKETTIEQDEDDNWIGGFIYHNPNNKRLMVKQRVGMGATVNAARPFGKVIYGFIVLMFIGVFISMIYIGMAEATPIKLKVENGKLICHHLTDDYVIDINEIESIEWGEDVNEVRFIKTAGFGIPNLYKGSFTVNGESGCKVFLNPEEGSYIKISAKGISYYISSASLEETRSVYDTLINY